MTCPPFRRCTPLDATIENRSDDVGIGARWWQQTRLDGNVLAAAFAVVGRSSTEEALPTFWRKGPLTCYFTGSGGSVLVQDIGDTCLKT